MNIEDVRVELVLSLYRLAVNHKPQVDPGPGADLEAVAKGIGYRTAMMDAVEVVNAMLKEVVSETV